MAPTLPRQAPVFGVAARTSVVYGLAVLLSALALEVLMAANQLFGNSPTLILFSVPIVLCAYQGGLGAGLVATFCSGLGACYFLLPPLESLFVARSGSRIQLLILLGSGILISVLCERLRRSRAQAEDTAADAKAKEARLQSAWNDARDLRAAFGEHAMIAVADAGGRISQVNDRFCAVSGFRREELLKQDYLLAISEHQAETAVREWWQALSHGQIWRGEIRSRAKDGNFYWVDATIVPFLDDDGQPRRYIAVQADITARKLVEEGRHKNEERLHAMVENIGEGLVLAELDGQVIHWNQAGLEMHGFENLEEGRDKFARFAQIFEVKALDGHPLEVAEWPLPRVLRGETLRECEVRLRRRDRTWERVFSYSGGIIQERTGRPLAFLRAVDITERLDTVAAIRGANADLEQRVAQRTAELESANKELEAFSYSVSHDLRSPLRAVDGFSQALVEDFGPSLPEEGRECIQAIREGAQRMGALIDDLLNFSRLSRQQLHKQDVATTQLVRAAWGELEHDGRSIEFVLGELPPCRGDPALLKQVWLNLLSNALKYSSRRNPAVIEVGAVTQNGSPTFMVRDNGAGFDMRYAHKLFGVFQRLHRDGDYPGTGVGLAIVQRIVLRHGGRIWAEGEPEHGATFYFTL